MTVPDGFPVWNSIVRCADGAVSDDFCWNAGCMQIVSQSLYKIRLKEDCCCAHSCDVMVTLLYNNVVCFIFRYRTLFWYPHAAEFPKWCRVQPLPIALHVASVRLHSSRYSSVFSEMRFSFRVRITTNEPGNARYRHIITYGHTDRIVITWKTNRNTRLLAAKWPFNKWVFSGNSIRRLRVLHNYHKISTINDRNDCI